MANFNEPIKTLIREVMTQELGIKNADVKDQVWAMVEHRMTQRINEAIDQKLNDDELDKAVTKSIEKIIASRMKSEICPFKTALQKKMEEAADRVQFTVSIKETP